MDSATAAPARTQPDTSTVTTRSNTTLNFSQAEKQVTPTVVPSEQMRVSRTDCSDTNEDDPCLLHNEVTDTEDEGTCDEDDDEDDDDDDNEALWSDPDIDPALRYYSEEMVAWYRGQGLDFEDWGDGGRWYKNISYYNYGQRATGVVFEEDFEPLD